MQISRFKTVALPLYVILDADNKILAKRAGIIKPAAKFLEVSLPTHSVEKNNTEVCVLTDKVCTTESSFLVVIPVLPFPPLF